MNVLKIFFSIICLTCVCIGSTFAQFSDKKLKDKANLYFKNQKYFEALQLYQQYDHIKKKDQQVKLRLGICHYFNNNISETINYLSPLVFNRKKANPKAHFYLGYAYHSKGEFIKAIKHYKEFLKNTSPKEPNRAAVKDDIKRCASALKLVYLPDLAIVENLGEKVNSRFDDFAPVQSPNRKDKIYFSSAREDNLGGLRNKEGILDELSGKYSSDIFSIIIQNGEWTNPKRLSNLLNSPQNDVIFDFNDDGTAMLLFKGFDYYSGQILIDSFKPIQEKPLFPPRFQSPASAERGDGAVFFFNDSTIIFSSRIDGGYGGSDLYVAQYSKGQWSAPQNLGEEVNSAYDETSPFLALDGRTLYFSSNKIHGAGGFDIYKTFFDDVKKQWITPQNLGFPINSPKDDLNFRLTTDGSQGFFSSSRIEGMGGKDIYTAYFKSQNIEQLMTSAPAGFHSVAFRDVFAEQLGGDYPIDEELVFRGEYTDYYLNPIYYNTDDDILSPSNITQLNKIINMMNEYPQLKIEISGNTDNQDQPQFALYFSIKRAEQIASYFIENGVSKSNIFVKGLGANFPIAKNKFGSETNLLGQRMNRRMDVKFFETRGVPYNFIVNAPTVEKAMSSSKGKYFRNAIKGLSYKVQVAEIKQNYNSSLILDYPNAMVESKANSPYYLYSLGLYQTFDSADLLQKDLQRIGITTAKIVPYIDGIRVMQSEFKSQSSTYPDLLNYINSASKD